MNILFLTQVNINSINERNLYTDLMRKFRNEGHKIYIVTPVERKKREKTKLICDENVIILKVKTLNFQKTNFIEKSFSLILIESQFKKAIRKYLSNISFDLIIYSTPPITFVNIISYFRNLNKAKTYLLLKDIFPQDAVDIGMMKKGGVIYNYFRKKEKQLYQISDHIGCMSPANVEYLKKHNPEINSEKIEVNPNSIMPINLSISEEAKDSIRKQFSLPVNATIFIYGGNLGKPQGIDFLLEVLDSNAKDKGVFFVVAGDGTEYQKVKNWFETNNPINAILLRSLPKNDYDKLILACDVGLIFLDTRFTIPNFPSRLLSYLENKLPVLAATDINSDLGKIAEENNFGFWVKSGDIVNMNKKISYLANNVMERKQMGKNGYYFLKINYIVTVSYEKIMSHFKN